jgi:hypothetical protein
MTSTSRLAARSVAIAAALVSAQLLSTTAHATEGSGLGVYPDGLENFLSGALPPPGVHALVYAGQASYDKLLNNRGDSAGPPDFKVDVSLVVPRVVWVTGQTVLGGQLAFEALLPVLDVKVTAGGANFSKTGLGDAIVGIALGHHHSPSLHSVVGFDVYVPTGHYDKTNPASLGKNIWAIQPIVAVSRIDPAGWNADMKLMWDINGRNSATGTRSGQALHADLDAGWGLGNGWVLGVAGHIFQQFTDDTGPNAGSGKASAMGFGPSLRYMSGPWLITAKWQNEFNVRNRPEGQQLLLKASLPF